MGANAHGMYLVNMQDDDIAEIWAGICIGHACSEIVEYSVKPVLWESMHRVICIRGSLCCKCRNVKCENPGQCCRLLCL